MAVKFLMTHTVGAQYEKDEIAGFDEDVEAELVKRKIAEPVKAKAESPAK